MYNALNSEGSPNGNGDQTNLSKLQGKTFDDQSSINQQTKLATNERETVIEEEDEEDSNERLTVNIEIGTGNFQTIVVNQWDDPLVVAAKFCNKMSLDTDLQKVLTE